MSFTAWLLSLSIPYDLIYKRNLINKTNEQNRTRDIETRNRLTVTRGEWGVSKGRKKGMGIINEQT